MKEGDDPPMGPGGGQLIFEDTGMMMKQGWVFEDQMFLKGWVLERKMFLEGSDKPRTGLIFQNITQKHTSSNNNAPRWVNFWKIVP